MKRVTWLVTLLISSSISWVSIRAQDIPAIKLSTDLVTINVSVADKKERPLPGLVVGDFLVTEDGKPVRLEFFASSGPASIVFVLDMSSSMEAKARELRGAFKKFLMGAHQDNDYSLITFNAAPRLVARSVTADEMWQSLSILEPFGNTALYDAVLLGLDVLDKTPQRHRALVVMSDGDDNRSRASLADVEQAVSSRHATVYTVGILARPKDLSPFDRHCRDLLTRLADATGGLIRFSPAGEIGQVLTSINTDVRNQYCLGYYAPEGEPGWRSLQVSLASSARSYNVRHQKRYLMK
jgi:Ca-activated chloride channel homolog